MLLINEQEKNRHIFFLENLLRKLRNDHLSNEENKELSEFYINYMFNRENTEIDDEKLKKYMFLGWYIYEFLNSNNNNIT
jgi:hypothetical protein